MIWSTWREGLTRSRKSEPWKSKFFKFCNSTWHFRHRSASWRLTSKSSININKSICQLNSTREQRWSFRLETWRYNDLSRLSLRCAHCLRLIVEWSRLILTQTWSGVLMLNIWGNFMILVGSIKMLVRNVFLTWKICCFIRDYPQATQIIMARLACAQFILWWVCL